MGYPLPFFGIASIQTKHNTLEKKLILILWLLIPAIEIWDSLQCVQRKKRNTNITFSWPSLKTVLKSCDENNYIIAVPRDAFFSLWNMLIDLNVEVKEIRLWINMNLIFWYQKWLSFESSSKFTIFITFFSSFHEYFEYVDVTNPYNTLYNHKVHTDILYL